MTPWRRYAWHVKNLFFRIFLKSFDFRFAQKKMLASATLTEEEKSYARNISLKVHSSDEMYVAGNAQHYLSVGLCALRCINAAFLAAGKAPEIHSILDFPCGHGRVARFLRARYPHADIVGAEIDAEALKFCAKTFTMTPLQSHAQFNDIKLGRKFDLIWCGSLVTHINQPSVEELLGFFCSHLSINGVCVFSAHGQRSAEWIRGKTQTYGLSDQAQTKILKEFDEKGFGYADYPKAKKYGISLASPSCMTSLAQRAGPWHKVYFAEHAWDEHQDVYAYCLKD